MAARPIDAAEGYRLYRRTRGLVQLDEINEYLRGLGLRSVSPRMLAHYGRLHRNGFESCLTINRLDLALAGEEAWSDELQTRYSELRQAVPAEVLFGASKSSAQIESMGLSTATLVGPRPPIGCTRPLRLLHREWANLSVVPLGSDIELLPHRNGVQVSRSVDDHCADLPNELDAEQVSLGGLARCTRQRRLG